MSVANSLHKAYNMKVEAAMCGACMGVMRSDQSHHKPVGALLNVMLPDLDPPQAAE